MVKKSCFHCTGIWKTRHIASFRLNVHLINSCNKIKHSSILTITTGQSLTCFYSCKNTFMEDKIIFVDDGQMT